MNLALGAAPATRHHLPVVDPARPDSPWVHASSGVRFLQRWEQVRAEGCHRYDATGENISVRYTAPSSLVVSAFVFPVSSGGRDAALVTFAHSVGDMLASLTRPQCAEESEVGLAWAGSEPLRGHRVQAIGTPAGPRSAPCVAIVEQFAHEGWILKLRVTCAPKTVALAERFLDAWLRASRFATRAPTRARDVGRSAGPRAGA